MTTEAERIAEEWDLSTDDLLQPLGDDEFDISVNAGGGEGRGTAYSQILADALKTGILDTVSWQRDYLPDKEQAKSLINGLMLIHRHALNAPCMNRMSRLQEAKREAEFWEKEMDGHEEAAAAKEQAELWYGRWVVANKEMDYIRSEVATRGWYDPICQAFKGRWYTAKEKIRLAEQSAAELPALTYQYFLARTEFYAINRELILDRARGVAHGDHSDFLERIRGGKTSEADIATNTTWAMKEAISFAFQHPGSKNPFWEHMERLIVGQQQTRRQRRFGGQRPPVAPPPEG